MHPTEYQIQQKPATGHINLKPGEDDALRLAAAKLNTDPAHRKSLPAFFANEYYWRDLGRPENVAEAEKDLGSGARA